MARDGFRVVDAEPHLEEPFDLWECNLPEIYRKRIKVVPPHNGHLDVGGRARSPKIEKTDDGWVVRLDWVNTLPEKMRPLVWAQAKRRWPATPHLAEATEHCRPEVYQEGFDIEGIDVGMLMPTSFGGIMSCDEYDPGLALALCQVYNEWAYEFTQANPERFKFWAMVPLQDPNAAAKEAERCMRKLGAVGVTAKDGGSFLANDAVLEPLWEALDALHAPVGFHGFCGGSKIPSNIQQLMLDPGHERTNFILGNRGPHAGEAAGLIFGGVLDKYPNIKPVFMEAGANGVPAMLEAMDDKWYLFGPDADFTLEMWPSEYYKTYCYTVTFAEGLLKYTIDYLGDDHLVFSSDYPHHDSPFPNAVKKFLAVEGVSEESKRKILWDNAARLFGLEAPTPDQSHAAGAV